MTGFGPPDDGETCSGCGCAMEVIGPPGPVHSLGCPYREKPGPPSRELSDDEVAFLFSLSPMPESEAEIELVLEARRTGRKLSPPKRGWTLA